MTKLKWNKVCCICGSTKDVSHFNKDKDNEYYQKVLCGRHRKQLSIHGKISFTWKDRNDYLIGEDYAEVLINKKEDIKIKIDLDDVFILEPYWITINSKKEIYGSLSKVKYLNPIINLIMPFKLHYKYIHINGDNLDFRKDNLKLVPITKVTKANKSGIIGVCFSSRFNKWIVGYKGKNIKLFKEFHEAVKLRLELEYADYGEHSPQAHLFEEYGIKVK